MSRWLSKHKKHLELVMHAFACDYKDHFFPSRAALTRGGVAEVNSECWTKQEFTATSKGLLLMLLWLTISRRFPKDRRRAHALMQSLLDRTLPGAGDSWHTKFEDMVAAARHRCEQSNGIGDCEHVAVFKDMLIAKAADTPMDKLVTSMVSLMQLANGKCSTLKDVRAEFIDEASCCLDASLLEGGFAVDLGSLCPAAQPGSKRRRIDEDFKSFVINQVVQKKKANSGSAFLRTATSVSPTMTSMWEEEHMAAYQVAMKRGFAAAKQVSVTSDAARLGDPPEETEIFLLWTPQGDCAAVAPPQVQSSESP